MPGRMQESGGDEPGEVEQAEHDDDALPTAIAAGGDEADESDGREWHGDDGRDAEAAHGERDGGELCDEGEEVDGEEIEERETAPGFAEALVDHGGVAFAGGDAEAGDHLLHEVADGEQQKEHPEQVVAVLATSLHVGGDCAGVVVGFHDDEAGAKGDEEAEDGALPRAIDARAADGSGGGLLHDGHRITPPAEVIAVSGESHVLVSGAPGWPEVRQTRTRDGRRGRKVRIFADMGASLLCCASEWRRGEGVRLHVINPDAGVLVDTARTGRVTPSDVREGDYRHPRTQRRRGIRGLGGSFVVAFDMKCSSEMICTPVVVYPPMV